MFAALSFAHQPNWSFNGDVHTAYGRALTRALGQKAHMESALIIGVPLTLALVFCVPIILATRSYVCWKTWELIGAVAPFATSYALTYSFHHSKSLANFCVETLAVVVSVPVAALVKVELSKRASHQISFIWATSCSIAVAVGVYFLVPFMPE